MGTSECERREKKVRGLVREGGERDKVEEVEITPTEAGPSMIDI